MSSVVAEAVVRNSYREQGRLCQTHRWLAALFAPTDQSTGRLCSETAQIILDGEALPTNKLGMPSLTFAVDDLAVDDVTETNTLRLDIRALRVGDSKTGHDRALMTLTFGEGDALLPPITQVSIDTNINTTQPLWNPPTTDLPPALPTNCRGPLSDAWIAHRLMALKHRWHALGESLVKTAPPYQEIITPGFAMDWGTGSVNGYAELESWLKNSASSMSAARHDVAAFEWLAKGEHHYQAIFDFHWNGISLKGEPMQAQSRHTWQVLDKPLEPFARIEHMQVEFLVPFHVVK